MKKSNKRPSSGLTKKQRSKVVKQIRAGKDMGEAGEAFDKVYSKSYKFYRKKGKSPAEARKIAKATAGKIMWKKIKRK